MHNGTNHLQVKVNFWLTEILYYPLLFTHNYMQIALFFLKNTQPSQFLIYRRKNVEMSTVCLSVNRHSDSGNIYFSSYNFLARASILQIFFSVKTGLLNLLLYLVPVQKNDLINKHRISNVNQLSHFFFNICSSLITGKKIRQSIQLSLL